MEHSLTRPAIAPRAQAGTARSRRPSPSAALAHARQRERVMASLLADCRTYRAAVHAHQ
jgi:hypothetical protein